VCRRSGTGLRGVGRNGARPWDGRWRRRFLGDAVELAGRAGAGRGGSGVAVRGRRGAGVAGRWRGGAGVAVRGRRGAGVAVRWRGGAGGQAGGGAARPGRRGRQWRGGRAPGGVGSGGTGANKAARRLAKSPWARVKIRV
jgi:hypothetical protein